MTGSTGAPLASDGATGAPHAQECTDATKVCLRPQDGQLTGTL
ncbi:hypothetical protein ACWCOZ_13655 [Streptomyces sp. NPDC001840]